MPKLGRPLDVGLTYVLSYGTQGSRERTHGVNPLPVTRWHCTLRCSSSDSGQPLTNAIQTLLRRAGPSLHFLRYRDMWAPMPGCALFPRALSLSQHHGQLPCPFPGSLEVAGKPYPSLSPTLWLGNVPAYPGIMPSL